MQTSLARDIYKHASIRTRHESVPVIEWFWIKSLRRTNIAGTGYLQACEPAINQLHLQSGFGLKTKKSKHCWRVIFTSMQAFEPAMNQLIFHNQAFFNEGCLLDIRY
ncbi:hypothetical protein [Ignatzschineria sp. LJL83]